MEGGQRDRRGAARRKGSSGLSPLQPPPILGLARLGLGVTGRSWCLRAKRIPSPHPAAEGAGTGGRGDGAARLLPLPARPPGELRPRCPSPSRSRCLRTGKFAEGPGSPQGQRVPGCGAGFPQSPPSGCPRFVPGSQGLGRAGGAGAGPPFRSLRRGRGTEHSAWHSRGTSPFPGTPAIIFASRPPVCGLELGQGWHRGRGLRRLSEPPGPAVPWPLAEAAGDRDAAPAREGRWRPGCGLSPLGEASATQVCFLGAQPTDCSF